MQFKTEEEAIAYAIAESLRLQDTSQIQEEKEEKVPIHSRRRIRQQYDDDDNEWRRVDCWIIDDGVSDTFE